MSVQHYGGSFELCTPLVSKSPSPTAAQPSVRHNQVLTGAGRDPNDVP
jgi:hypothetical protein